MFRTRSTPRRRLEAATVVVAVAVLAGTVISPALASDVGRQAAAPPSRPTVVLVHGAWADSGSWDAVTRQLITAGYPVRAFANPLQTLSGDAGALRDFIDAIPGPIVLVGHSYGGAVITNAASGDDQVRALVYIDAFAPRQGDTVFSLPGAHSALTKDGVLQLVPAGAPTPTTELYVQPDAFARYVANDLDPQQAELLAASQRPVTLGALMEASGVPAWQTIPSWYEIGTKDQIITPHMQQVMATWAGAHITWAATGHLPMVSNPYAVVRTIELAARGTAAATS
jgi:pimeloyl-ACP methyl ester carboxylesterase